MKRKFILAGVIILSIIIGLIILWFSVPHPGQTVSDIRITAKLVHPKDSQRPCVRIYYGYQENGIWFDYPAESYDLLSIFSRKAESGLFAAGDSHIVKIGDYLLISIANNRSNLEGTPADCVVYDSLGSEFKKLFTEYFSPPYGPNAGQYGFYAERKGLGYSTGISVASSFGEHYYVVLKYDSLPKDYVLTCTMETPKGITTEELTYSVIKTMIGE